MHLSPADVRRLYGNLLFRVEHPAAETTSEAAADSPAAPAPATVPPAFLKGGSAIEWKLKENSQLALIIGRSEFGDKALTGLLKQCMLQSGIDLTKVGFGVMPDDTAHLDVTDMPTPAGVLFQPFSAQADNPVMWASKVLFEGSRLASLNEEAKRQELILMLRQCQEWMK